MRAFAGRAIDATVGRVVVDHTIAAGTGVLMTPTARTATVANTGCRVNAGARKRAIGTRPASVAPASRKICVPVDAKGKAVRPVVSRNASIAGGSVPFAGRVVHTSARTE